MISNFNKETITNLYSRDLTNPKVLAKPHNSKPPTTLLFQFHKQDPGNSIIFFFPDNEIKNYSSMSLNL